jgi:hypothetical protein
MFDIECPYCGHEQDVCRDDFGYEEDKRHEVECEECEKRFVFTVFVTHTFRPAKADCLNGGEHQWKMSSTIPRRFSRWCCTTCDAVKLPTPEEIAALEQRDSQGVI